MSLSTVDFPPTSIVNVLDPDAITLKGPSYGLSKGVRLLVVDWEGCGRVDFYARK